MQCQLCQFTLSRFADLDAQISQSSKSHNLWKMYHISFCKVNIFKVSTYCEAFIDEAFTALQCTLIATLLEVRSHHLLKKEKLISKVQSVTWSFNLGLDKNKMMRFVTVVNDKDINERRLQQ